MSGIFGYVNFNGQPLTHQTLLTMQKPMLYWGPHGQYLWNQGTAGMGQLKLINTPQCENETFPLIDNELNLVFMCVARIDNRPQLFKLLNIPPHQHFSITDAELIFLAYKKYNKQCLTHLLGDFTFAVYHTLSNTLFVARDQFGISGLYYHQTPNGFIFACSLKGLLALPQVPKQANQHRLNEIENRLHGNGVETAYKNIYKLPPANYLEVSSKGIKKTNYWQPSQTAIRYSNPDQYYQHFRELFTETVQCRLRTNSNVASTLSAGFDSTTVSVVAANLLKLQGKQLTSYTSVPAFESNNVPPHKLVNEGPLAALTAAHNGNIKHVIENAKDASVLQSLIDGINIHDEPSSHVSNSFWIHHIFAQAAKQNNVLLNAQMGNFTISWPTNGYYSHLQKGVYIYNLSVLKLKIKKLLGLTNNELNFISNQSKTDLYKYLEIGKNHSGQIYNNLGAWFGLNIWDPTYDIRLINFVLNIPEHILFNANASRLLIRKTFENELPAKITANNLHGLQAADLCNRVFNNNNELSEFIKEKYQFINKKTEIEKYRVLKLLVLYNIIYFCKSNSFERNII